MLDRRAFLVSMARTAALSVVALGGSSLAFSACRSNDTSGGSVAPLDDGDDRPIVVVGAGMAGLASGRALHDAGRTVVIVEARDRIGGRTFTTEVGPASVDLGAAWIHGDRGNPVAELVSGRGLAYELQPLDLNALYDGTTQEFLDTTAIGEVLEVVDSFETAAFDLLSEFGDQTYAAAIAAYLDQAGLTGSLRRRSQFTLEAFVSEYSAPIAELSLEGVIDGEDLEFDGGDHVIEGGYRKLVDSLAAGLDVRTGVVVDHIRHDDQGVAVEAAGETIEASHVIATVPLGVLKAGAIRFSPLLPSRKQEAIDRLGFGFFEKVILVFDDHYWRDIFTGALGYFGGLGNDREFPVWVDMSPFAGAPTLVCIFSGSFAEESMRSMSEGERIARAMEILRGMVGTNVPDPVAAAATAWTNDPFARGAYSYLPVGSDAGDMRALAEPVNGRLLFAGEATNAQYYQSVHGAFLSGLREARRLVPTAAIG